MNKDFKKSSNKNILINAGIFIALIVATFFFVFKDQDLGGAMKVIGESNILFIILGLALMLGYFATQSWNVWRLLNQLGEKVSFKQALKYTFIEFFFCSVTPGASGGQPVEIYYMNKDKVSVSKGTLAILIQTCGIQIAVMVLGLLGLIFTPHLIANDFLFLYIFGLFINGLALLLLLVGLFFPKLTHLAVNAIFDFVEKITKKTFKKQRKTVDAELKKFSEGSAYIKKNPKEFRNAALRCILQMTLYFFIPFCVYHAMGLSGTHFWDLFAMQAILFMATCALPLPGAVGASEAAFLSIYASAFGQSHVAGAMLLSRIISFYFFVVVSLGVVGFVTFFEKRKK